MRRTDEREAGAHRTSARWGRRLAAVVLMVAGGLFVVLATPWRGAEASLSGHAIQLVTGEHAVAVPGRHLLILYKSTAVQSVFVLTSECSVVYLVAALFILAAPLMLLRRLSPWRTAAAIVTTATILTVVNIARLTAIGATVSTWGTDPGLAIAHTYLGSVLTVVGTSAAGLAFAAVLLTRRNAQRRVIG